VARLAKSREVPFFDAEEAAAVKLGATLQQMHHATAHAAASVPKVVVHFSPEHVASSKRASIPNSLTDSKKKKRRVGQNTHDSLVRAIIDRCDHSHVETILVPGSCLPPWAVTWAVTEALTLATVAVRADHKHRFATKLRLFELALPTNSAVSRLKIYVRNAALETMRQLADSTRSSD